MYSVVGCSDCDALWVVDGRPETTKCPRCGKTEQFATRKQFVTTDDRDHAREVRASMLAARQGHGDAFAALDSVAEMETYLDDVGVSDDEYLERSGLDTDEVNEAGDRLDSGAGSGSRSRKEVVTDALDELDGPTEADVVDYATDHGVPAEYARKALEKLVRAGEASESGGRYRRL
ncbi:DUF5817 domain-containing protein [Halospeciosus flavus]|uniref:DUF5817 domain-containing protein n=1 Tax=Halospeciosus flavus TaxID=3032283 RepID=A0ABD5Z8R5_9EURY|nr:DUF5817 domain-containing protein [Halospeciosus flavus]